jgi:hypothetical protein
MKSPILHLNFVSCGTIHGIKSASVNPYGI